LYETLLSGWETKIQIIRRMTFLAIDIGNTRLKWAMYDDHRPGAALLAHGAEFLEHIERLAEGCWAGLPAPTRMLGCVVAGDTAKRRVHDQIELMLGWTLEPQWVVPSVEEAGVVNGYDHPSRLGADRWVAMIGARHQMLQQGPARPLIVVMVGTAVTVDALDADGNFLGGLIIPGHGIMLRALEGGTAGLHVPTGEVRLFPKNTSDALTSGGTYAIAGAVERMYQHLSQHCGAEPACIMAGGAGWKMAPSMTRPFQLLDNLIFDGLQVMAQRRWG
jgi:type III pantothenate kinase